MLSTSSYSSKSSQRFLRISAIHHNMTHFISESTVHEYQYSIEHFPETSSLITSGYGTNYDFSICSTVVDKQSHQKIFEHNLGLELYSKVTYLPKEIDWYHFQPCGRIFIYLLIFWLKKKKKIKPHNDISTTSQKLE